VSRRNDGAHVHWEVLPVKFHEAVARSLHAHGVDTVFGVLGDGNLFAFNSFAQLEGTRFRSMSHEAGAVLAALGYAQTSGRLGVATVTHGPGLTNTLTALVEAARAHCPLLLVAGDTPPDAPHHLQAVDQASVARAGEAGFVEVRSAATIGRDVGVAVAEAYRRRGPVVLDIGAELTWADVDDAVLHAGNDAAGDEARPDVLDPDAMDEALGVLAAARRPVILAGRGAISGSSPAALIELSAVLGCPLATTLRGKDLFRDHPHALGIFGTLSSPVALDVINTSDAVISFGASLNRWTTLDGSLLKGKALVDVDVDRHKVLPGSPRHAVSLRGDVGEVGSALANQLGNASVPTTGFASPDMAGRLAAWDPAGSITDASTDTSIDLRTAMIRLEAAFPRERTVVVDGGRFAHAAMGTLRVPFPGAYLHTLHFGSIGLGLAEAVGAHAAAPDRPVLLVAGDGGFMLGGLHEFSSAVRQRMDLVVVVLNDNAYGAEYVQLADRGMDPEICTFAWASFAGVAEALGGVGVTASNLAELDVALRLLDGRDRTRPMLIEVTLDPATVPSAAYL
jgi:thiamine pyrophosphate-dependent acetolactate synthase large subunit-like protein